MSLTVRSPLVLARTSTDGPPRWVLVRASAPSVAQTERTATEALEARGLDPQESDDRVQAVMAELEAFSSHRALTPGGASWLHVQHVPVRRLVGQVVRKLLALSSWEPFAQAPGPIAPDPHEALIGMRETSSREYHLYTVTWSGIAYLLGAPAPRNPMQAAPLRKLTAPHADVAPLPSLVPSTLPQSEVLALSWSSRHAETLLPVLKELAHGGHRSVLVDLATDAAERCPEPAVPPVRLCPAPSGLLSISGTISGLCLTGEDPADGSKVVCVRELAVRLDRFERLAAAVLETNGGCTQPSWRSTIRTETWLDGVLAATRPHTVLVSNDTSPLGALAVHAAERHGITTVYVQHGAWAPQSVAWPALHSRHIIVMGERDIAPAKAWARHPEAEIHVLGQPRFDALAGLDHSSQRRYLHQLLSARPGHQPEKIVVWACQPFGPDLLSAQADLILDGLRKTEGDWGLVIAPHPAQSPTAFDHVLEETGSTLAAIAEPRVGARGCLAGADAVVSAYSTCGIEAALLGIPVLELTLPGRTLGLADHGLAERCDTADDIADTLSKPERPARVPADTVCHWRGTSARDIAHLIVDRSQTSPT
ncbi:hypothetical protein ACFY1P_34165 [Streptomyces sp. NPDC001407]|uniref:hypothetical protein n=1 Tax=Streptomyces sp. NPDC001407 TaxID=3364573 RepID=UPI003680A334